MRWMLLQCVAVLIQAISLFGTKPHARMTLRASSCWEETRQRNSSASSAKGGRGKRRIPSVSSTL